MFTVYKINYIYRARVRHLELNLQKDVGSKACLLDVLPPSIFYVAGIGIQPYQALRELDTKKARLPEAIKLHGEAPKLGGEKAKKGRESKLIPPGS